MKTPQHTGLAYEGIDRFLNTAVPYLRAGVECGEAVIAVTSRRNLDALRDALGPARRHVDLFDNSQWYGSPARTLTRYLQYWGQRCESGWMPLRLLGEPIMRGHETHDVDRWTVFESGINNLMKSMPVRMLCPYDLSIDANHLHQIEVCHPHIAAGANTKKCTRFVDPQSFMSSRCSVPLSVPKAGVLCVPFDGEMLTQLRTTLAKFAEEQALSRSERIDLYVAVGEAAANAVKHGGGVGMLRVWREKREIVADVVCYKGRIEDVMQGYLPPAPLAESGRGMWIMRQLCDWVEVRPQSSGSTVRMHLRVGPT